MLELCFSAHRTLNNDFVCVRESKMHFSRNKSFFRQHILSYQIQSDIHFILHWIAKVCKCYVIDSPGLSGQRVGCRRYEAIRRNTGFEFRRDCSQVNMKIEIASPFANIQRQE